MSVAHVAGLGLQHLAVGLDDVVEPADDVAAIGRAPGCARKPAFADRNRIAGSVSVTTPFASRRGAIAVVVGAPVAGGRARVAHVGLGGAPDHRHPALEAERLLDRLAFAFRFVVVQRRELLVHVGDPRLGLADEPERAAREGEHDGGDEGTGD